jgi:hypothetical protein
VESIVGNIERLFDTAQADSPPIEVDVSVPYVMQSRSTALFRWTLATQRPA